MKTAPLPSHDIGNYSVLLGRMIFFNSLEENYRKIIEKREFEHHKLIIELIKKKQESQIKEEDINADFSSFQ